MGDSQVMTIEFLRARLLSERSVSRTARQQADQLAQRVMELEEQLRIVTIQRKRAEKAAAEVLAILESQGAGDFSEVIDSSSEQDEDSDKTKGQVDDMKEDETSTASRMERSEMEDRFSGSELEASPSQGRSLSWKSRSNSPDSIEKRRLKQMVQRQRRSSIMSSVGSSPKHRSGKSCRKVKKREMGYNVEENTDNTTRIDAHENEDCAWSNLSDVQAGNHREASQSLYANVMNGNEDMERVLEQRDQLIGQYEAEENAQREWEEKYNESKSSILGFSEPGMQPALEEISCDPKDIEAKLAAKYSCDPEKSKSSTETNSHPEEQVVQKISTILVPANQWISSNNLEKSGSSDKARTTAISNGIVPNDMAVTPGGTSFHAHSNGSFHPEYNAMAVRNIGTSSQEFMLLTNKDVHMIRNGQHSAVVPYEKSDAGSCSNSSSYSNNYRLHENQPSAVPLSSNDGEQLSIGLSPAIGRQQLHKLPEASKSSLGSVLEALQQAKISLQQQLVAPSPSLGTLAVAVPTYARIGPVTSDIPVGSAGLFRLPTDSFPKDTQLQPSFYGSRLNSTTLGPNPGYLVSKNNHQYSRASYLEAGPRVSVGKQYSDPYDMPGLGIPKSSGFSLSNSNFNPDGMLVQYGFSSVYRDTGNQMPSPRDPYMYGGNGACSDHQRL